MKSSLRKTLRGYEKDNSAKADYLSYYNHALQCARSGEIDNATNSVIHAIMANPSYASSHLLLSNIMAQKNCYVKTILPLYFFLMLEPLTARAKQAYSNLLESITHQRMSKPQHGRFAHVGRTLDSDFASAELSMGILFPFTNQSDEFSAFLLYNELFFKTLGELRKDNTNFWWDFYVNFFVGIQKSGLIGTYSHLAAQGSESQRVKKWLQDNPDKLSEWDWWLSH